MDRLAIVVPCYNEEEVFETTNGVLLEVLNDLIGKGKIPETERFLISLFEQMFETVMLGQMRLLAPPRSRPPCPPTMVSVRAP